MKKISLKDPRVCKISEFLLLFSFIFIRYVYFGFNYYKQLDDSIQYHLYSTTSTLMQMINSGLLEARPLAGIADVIFWSLFYGQLIIALVLVSAMLASSALMLRDVFKKYFKCGAVFLIFVCLVPSNLEAVYWLSASSRIVVGLFFATIALVFFERWLRSGKLLDAVLYGVFQLIGFGFYEQVFVFSVTVTLIVAVLDFFGKKKPKSPRPLLSLVSFLNAGIYFLFTSFFKGGQLYSARTELALPTTPWYYKVFLPELLSQLKHGLLSSSVKIFAKGFIYGVERIIKDRAFLFIIILAVLLFLFVLFRRIGKKSEGRSGVRWYVQLICAILLTAAPLAPFFIVGNTWFSLRCAFLSYIGIGLILELIFEGIFGQLKSKEAVRTVLCTVFAAAFIISAIPDMYDYKISSEKDEYFVELCRETFTRDMVNLDICVLGVEPSYTEYDTYVWHEHIHGVTESNWAFEGAYKSYVCENEDAVYVRSLVPIPLSSEEIYRQWQYDNYHITRFDYIYLYRDGGLIPLDLEIRSDKIVLKYKDGTEFAFVTESDGVGRITLK